MKELLNKYKKLIIIMSFAYIYLLFILLAPTNYLAITPGELTSVSNNYEINEVKLDNDISTISVYSWNRVTVLQKWLIENNSRYTLREKTNSDKELSTKDRNLQGKISLKSSHDNAVITAYTYANRVNNNINIKYNFIGFSVYESNHPDVSIGDTIKIINDTSINSNSYEDYLNIFELYTNNNYIINKEYKVKLENEQEVNFNKNHYLIYYPKYEIIESNPSINLFKDKASVGGPSGGMIETLAIYSALLEIKYEVKIAGTGTINVNNDYEVGKIGGIKQKYLTAYDNKVDVFIVPLSQIVEFESIIKNDKMKIIGVTTFDDVITNFIREDK